VAHRLRCASHTLKAPQAFGESIKRGIGGFTIAGHMQISGGPAHSQGLARRSAQT
jgi:hypothetical protein